jgi:hypothetical protein
MKSSYQLSLIVVFVSVISMDVFAQSNKIMVNGGPEDISIDTITDPENPRLLASCNSRRKEEAKASEIYTIDTKTEKAEKLKRIGEPKDFCFNPHGIDLVKVKDSLILLVVNHCYTPYENSIVRYLVKADALYFLNKFTSPLFTSPNAVAGLPNGDYILSNDASKHNAFDEMLFKLKKSNVVYCSGNDCNIAAGKVCYGNGLLILGDTVYQASTMPGEVYRYQLKDRKLINKEVIMKAKGADNLRQYGNEILVASHLKFGKFLAHMKNSKKKSPTMIYAVNTYTKTKRVIYYNKGEEISAASTGLIYRDKLYIAQIFDGFVLSVMIGGK